MNLKKVLVGALATTMVLGMSMVASAEVVAGEPTPLKGNETIEIDVEELKDEYVESITIDFDFSNGTWGGGGIGFNMCDEKGEYVGWVDKDAEGWENLAFSNGGNESITIPVSKMFVDREKHDQNVKIMVWWGAYADTQLPFYMTISKDYCEHENATVVDKADATCTEDGYTGDEVCPDCGKVTEGAVVPATGHSAAVVPAVDATCTATGLTEGSECSVCGEVLTAQTVVAALGHDWVDGEDCSRCGAPYCDHVDKGTDTANAIEATCTKPGYTGDTVCANCGECLEKGEEVAALGHTPVDGEGKDATCTEDGLTNGSVCSVCDAVIEEQVVIPALGHNFVDGVCSVCGAEDPDAAPADPEDPAEEPTEEPTEAPSETPDDGEEMPPLGSAAPVAVAAMLALVAGAVVVSSKKRA